MTAKRLFDLICVVPSLVLLGPFFLVTALWIKWDSPGPVFFRQVRIGKQGKHFKIFKFRTMVVQAEATGRQITVGQDPRITRSGRFLRKHKLDELPQLVNVFVGDMSLVGPRPEVPKYVEHYPEEAKAIILSVRPGITDFASIEFRNENDILTDVDEPETYYVETILPKKLALHKKYVAQQSLLNDIILIIRTFWELSRNSSQH